MSDDKAETTALKVLWATLRNHLAPELQTPLAKDRAKRADLALLRLVAGHELLPALRAEYAPRYAGLHARAQLMAREAGIAAATAPLTGPSGAGNPVFVGLPGVAGELEALMEALVAAINDQPRLAPSIDLLIRDVVRMERDCRMDYEARVTSMASARAGAEAPGAVLTIQTLQRYIAAHPRGSAAVEVSAVNEIPGGRSKRTVLVTLANAGSLPGELVLRMDTGRNAGAAVIDEFPLLDRVARLGLPVPEPLWLEAASTPFGNPFIVFRRMPGSAAGDLIEGAHRKVPATGLSLARALARVHAGGTVLIDSPAERNSSVVHTQQLLQRYFDYWRAKKPFPSLTVEAAFSWLFRHLHDGLGPPTVVHADTGFHNMLLDEAGNGCLLDWEFAHLGDPAEDLASCRPAVEKCLPWDAFMAEYQAHGGLPVSDFRLRFFEIWRPLRNAVLCGNVLHALMQGEADDMDPVTIGLSTFARLQADLARSLDGMLA